MCGMYRHTSFPVIIIKIVFMFIIYLYIYICNSICKNMFTYVHFEVYIYNWFVMVALYVVVILQCIMSGKCVYGC